MVLAELSLAFALSSPFSASFGVPNRGSAFASQALASHRIASLVSPGILAWGNRLVLEAGMRNNE